MAVRKVSISNLPHTDGDLNSSSLFVASTKKSAGSQYQSKQVTYAELYEKLLSDIRTSLGIPNQVGKPEQPIYIKDGKFTPSNGVAGTQGVQTNGVPYMKPVYLSAGTLSGASISLGSNATNDVKPLFMTGGSLMPMTANSGAANTPVYIAGGSIKPLTYTSEPGVALANNQTPIVMTNGQIGKMPSIGQDANNSVQPVKVTNGRITSISSTVGSTTNPVYINAGKIVPGTKPIYDLRNCGDTGNEQVPIYVDEDGNFAECAILEKDKALITGKRFEIVATVLFSNDKSVLSDDYVYSDDQNSDHYNDPEAEFRVAHPSKYSDGTDGSSSKCFFRGIDHPVNFKIPEDGWYLVHAEGGNNPMAVGIKINNSWKHTHPFFQNKNGGALSCPNLIYIDSAVRQTIDPIFHLSAGMEIGVYSCIKNISKAAKYTADTWYINSATSTNSKFKKNGSYKSTFKLSLPFTQSSYPGLFGTSMNRGTKDAPFSPEQFNGNVKSAHEIAYYKDYRFYVYKNYSIKKLYVTKSKGSYYWKTVAGTYDTPKLSAIHSDTIKDIDAVKDEYKSSRQDMYDNKQFIYVTVGTIKQYTAYAQNIANISYIGVGTNESWGDNDVVELIYLS